MLTAECPRRIAPRVAASERSHRRIALFGVLMLLLLGILPVIIDDAPTELEAALTGVDHLGALCVAALHLLLAPVHGGFHVLLGAGIGYALFDRLRAWRKLSAALRPLDAFEPRPGGRIWTAAVSAGLLPSRIRVVVGLPNPAFTVGIVAPMIYVAAELPLRLNAEQLQSVLSHEAAHVARRDPLRLTLLRGLAAALFWIPALARLAEDLGDDSEIVADDMAANRGEPVVLASAILALADWRAESAGLPRAAVGFCHGALLERRVRRLLGEDVPVSSHMTRLSLSLAMAALAIVWASGVLMAHPLPASDARRTAGESHCEHAAESPLAHLFCRGGSHSGDCRHGTASATASHKH